MVDRLIAKISNGDEQNEYEALRAIAEYYKAKGDNAMALATTDRMQPLATNSGLQWGLGLLRAEILRNLNRSEEAYDLLRPMIDIRSDDRLGQLRQQLNEMDTMTELDELRIHKHVMQFWYAVGIALIIIVSLCVVIVLRYRSAKKLKKANTQLQQAYDQLEETTSAKERIESELRIARDIQMSMVPNQFPTCDRLDLFATMTPARQVGGDLYDVLLIDNSQLYFCVGDVSGKGVPASLFMAETIRLFRALAKFRGEPAEIATYMNNELTEGNDSGMFVTMFIGRLNLDSGQLTFCNCGHNPPVLGCGSADAAFLQMETNAPIGIVPDIEYAGETIADVKNQPLFVYTDGLNEAENARQEQFGDEHLLEVIQQRPFTTARELIDTLTAMVEEHRKGAEPNDDLTMFCLSLH
jgi:serine phosphatase RsbU (regulator of sigma subunit)